jgi:hypothetical protein
LADPDLVSDEPEPGAESGRFERTPELVPA